MRHNITVQIPIKCPTVINLLDKLRIRLIICKRSSLYHSNLLLLLQWQDHEPENEEVYGRREGREAEK